MAAAVDTESTGSIGQKILTITAFIFLLPAVPVLVAAMAPVAARWGFPLLAMAAVVAMFRPLPIPLMSTKLGAVGLLYLALWGAAFGFSQPTDAELEALRASDPDGYLEAVRTSRGDTDWLEALAELRPEQHAAELARREQEEQERQARRAAEREQRAAERQARERAEREHRVASYVEQLQRELDGLRDFDAGGYTESRDSILLAVALFGAWAQIVEEGKGLPLSEQQEALRQRLRTQVAEVQSRALPRLRDAYGPAMRRVLWEHDMTARTFGPGFTTIQFVGGVFAANRNIQAFNEGAREALNALRFKQVRYKWYAEDQRYTYYTFESPSDRELVVWAGSGRYRTVD